jgi:hypothetical protein
MPSIDHYKDRDRELKTMIFVNASLFKDLEVEKMELEKKPS